MSLNIKKCRCVILAGGLGTRVRHMLSDLPKPMAPCLGTPFVEWILRYLGKQGISEAVLSTGYQAEIIASHFLPLKIENLKVEIVNELTQLGTGGGFLNCVASYQTCPEPELWLVTNGDSLTVTPLAPIFEMFDDPSVTVVIVGLRMEDASRYGTLEIDSHGNIIGFIEKRSGSGIINVGVYALRHSVVKLFSTNRPLSLENDVFPTLIKKSGVKALVIDAPFLDIGTPETLVEAEGFIKANIKYF